MRVYSIKKEKMGGGDGGGEEEGEKETRREVGERRSTSAAGHVVEGLAVDMHQSEI